MFRYVLGIIVVLFALTKILENSVFLNSVFGNVFGNLYEGYVGSNGVIVPDAYNKNDTLKVLTSTIKKAIVNVTGTHTWGTFGAKINGVASKEPDWFILRGFTVAAGTMFKAGGAQFSKAFVPGTAQNVNSKTTSSWGYISNLQINKNKFKLKGAKVGTAARTFVELSATTLGIQKEGIMEKTKIFVIESAMMPDIIAYNSAGEALYSDDKTFVAKGQLMTNSLWYPKDAKKVTIMPKKNGLVFIHKSQLTNVIVMKNDIAANNFVNIGFDYDKLLTEWVEQIGYNTGVTGRAAGGGANQGISLKYSPFTKDGKLVPELQAKVTAAVRTSAQAQLAAAVKAGTTAKKIKASLTAAHTAMTKVLAIKTIADLKASSTTFTVAAVAAVNANATAKKDAAILKALGLVDAAIVEAARVVTLATGTPAATAINNSLKIKAQNLLLISLTKLIIALITFESGATPPAATPPGATPPAATPGATPPAATPGATPPAATPAAIPTKVKTDATAQITAAAAAATAIPKVVKIPLSLAADAAKKALAITKIEAQLEVARVAAVAAAAAAKINAAAKKDAATIAAIGLVEAAATQAALVVTAYKKDIAGVPKATAEAKHKNAKIAAQTKLLTSITKLIIALLAVEAAAVRQAAAAAQAGPLAAAVSSAKIQLGLATTAATTINAAGGFLIIPPTALSTAITAAKAALIRLAEKDVAKRPALLAAAVAAAATAIAAASAPPAAATAAKDVQAAIELTKKTTTTAAATAAAIKLTTSITKLIGVLLGIEAAAAKIWMRKFSGIITVDFSSDAPPSKTKLAIKLANHADGAALKSALDAAAVAGFSATDTGNIFVDAVGKVKKDKVTLTLVSTASIKTVYNAGGKISYNYTVVFAAATKATDPMKKTLETAIDTNIKTAIKRELMEPHIRPPSKTKITGKIYTQLAALVGVAVTSTGVINSFNEKAFKAVTLGYPAGATKKITSIKNAIIKVNKNSIKSKVAASFKTIKIPPIITEVIMSTVHTAASIAPTLRCMLLMNSPEDKVTVGQVVAQLQLGLNKYFIVQIIAQSQKGGSIAAVMGAYTSMASGSIEDSSAPGPDGKPTTELDLSPYVLKSSIPPCAHDGPVESPFATDEFYSNFESCYQSYRPVGIGNKKDFLECLGFDDAYKATKPSVPFVSSAVTQKPKKKTDNVFEDMGDFVKDNLVYIVIGASVVISAMIVADKYKGKVVPVEDI